MPNAQKIHKKILDGKHRFAIGDRVTWTSQAAGSATKKTGEVVEIVAPRSQPWTFPSTASNRDHESYVVVVIPPSKARYPERWGKPKPRKEVRYWPVVSKLKRAPAQKAGK